MPAAVRYPFLFLLFLWSLLVFPAQAQVAFRTEVLYDQVGVDKAFQVQYSLENAGSLTQMDIRLASPFTVIGDYADATRTSTQITNGTSRTTRTYTRTYTLRASQTGFFPLPMAVARTTDGKTYRSDVKMVEVLRDDPRKTAQAQDPFADPFGGPDPFGPDPFSGNPFGPGSPLDRIADAFRQGERYPTAAELSGLAFLEIVPRKRTAYEGEPVIVEYLLVSGISVSGNLNKMPAPDGFWVEEIGGEKEERGTRVVGDKIFQTLLIKRVALIPQRTGSLTIEPAEMQAVGTIDDGFGNGQQHSWMIKSAPVRLQIKPLPVSGKPASFKGAVGQYRIEASLEPPAMPQNGSSALRVTISGEGNLAQLDAPQLSLPKGLQTESPIAKNSLQTDGQRLTGTRTFTYPVTATEEGNFTLPEIRFPFFNPETETYEVAASPALTLSVTPAEMVEESTTFTDKGKTSFLPILLFVLVALGAGILLWRRSARKPALAAEKPFSKDRYMPPAPATPTTALVAPSIPEIPVAPAVNTTREALSALETLVKSRTGHPFSALSTERLQALSMDALTAERLLLFRKKAEAALYGGMDIPDAGLVEEGRWLLSVLSNWQAAKSS